MEEEKKAVRQTGKGKPVLELEAQEWGMFYKGKVITLSKPTIEGIKAQPTHIMGWFETELMEVWANIFPLTPVSRIQGFLPLSDPTWGQWTNPWWVFLTDVPSREEREIFGWRGMPSALREPILGDYNKEDTLLERRMLLGEPIVVNLLGNREGRKVIQVFLPTAHFNLVISQRELQMGIMEHVALFNQGEGFTKRFLVELGWSILE